jgi:hypothetical protein
MEKRDGLVEALHHNALFSFSYEALCEYCNGFFLHWRNREEHVSYLQAHVAECTTNMLDYLITPQFLLLLDTIVALYKTHTQRSAL